jgi:hypothetical protein
MSKEKTFLTLVQNIAIILINFWKEKFHLFEFI